MYDVAQIAVLLCALIDKPPGCRLPHNLAPKAVAAVVVESAQKYQLNPWNLAAVLAHESGLNRFARGQKGELGLGQLYRGTMATRGFDHLSDDELMRPEINIRLAARHLARVKRVCRGWETPVEYWVGVYSGRGCGITGYGVRIKTRLLKASGRLE